MESVLREKSFAFALRIVKLAQFLTRNENEFVLSRQVLRSGTAIGALICEAQYAQSRADFINKLSIALKEANETYYWLRLLHKGEYITEVMYSSIKPQINELIKLLTSSIKTAKQARDKQQNSP
ncbi:MAG TPA: four helix bundle protein [Gammaproteobacteria bacterium]|nr:four helix bundle protein [Gammaproteobacteria bacterium]